MSLSAQDLAALAQLVNNARPGRNKAKSSGVKRVKLTDEQLTANAAKNAVAAVQMFEQLGYKNCVAHETIKSGGRWIAAGRVPLKGKSHRLGTKGYPLWHLDDTKTMEDKAGIASKPN